MGADRAASRVFGGNHLRPLGYNLLLLASALLVPGSASGQDLGGDLAGKPLREPLPGFAPVSVESQPLAP